MRPRVIIIEDTDLPVYPGMMAARVLERLSLKWDLDFHVEVGDKEEEDKEVSNSGSPPYDILLLDLKIKPSVPRDSYYVPHSCQPSLSYYKETFHQILALNTFNSWPYNFGASYSEQKTESYLAKNLPISMLTLRRNFLHRPRNIGSVVSSTAKPFECLLDPYSSLVGEPYYIDGPHRYAGSSSLFWPDAPMLNSAPGSQILFYNSYPEQEQAIAPVSPVHPKHVATNTARSKNPGPAVLRKPTALPLRQ